jgi:hypothetical protein
MKIESIRQVKSNLNQIVSSPAEEALSQGTTLGAKGLYGRVLP